MRKQMLLTPVQLLVGVGDDVVMGSRKPFGTSPTTTPPSSPVTLKFLPSVKQNRGAFSHFRKTNIGTICCQRGGAKLKLGNPLSLYRDGNEGTMDEAESPFFFT